MQFTKSSRRYQKHLQCTQYTRNTEDLKVRTVPCLCQGCINDDGQECANSNYTEPWREVDLIPVKGESKRKHAKRKLPKPSRMQQKNGEKQDVDEDHEDDASPETEHNEQPVPDDVVENPADLTVGPQLREESGTELFIDLTGGKNVEDEVQAADNLMKEDNVIIGSDHNDHAILPEIGVNDEEIPDRIYWESLLASLENCELSELETFVLTLLGDLKPLQERKFPVHFDPTVDWIDATASALIPPDTPDSVDAIWTLGDGNCIGRAIGKSFSGDDSMHLEI